jgi:hypothetical protein
MIVYERYQILDDLSGTDPQIIPRKFMGQEIVTSYSCKTNLWEGFTKILRPRVEGQNAKFVVILKGTHFW